MPGPGRGGDASSLEGIAAACAYGFAIFIDHAAAVLRPDVAVLVAVVAEVPDVVDRRGVDFVSARRRR